MCAVDKGPEVVRGPVQACRREQVDPVVTPAKVAGKLRDWHDLEERNPGLRQLWHELTCRSPRSFSGECTDMHLVDHLTFDANAFPTAVAPPVRFGVHDLRRAMRPVWLKPGCGIRKKLISTVEPEP